jgi:predicted transcriptional regulator
VSTPTKCENPACSCDPCSCADCVCGVSKLGELERRVMEILWKEPNHELTGRYVADAFPESAYTTVATVLDRLVRKGFVRRRMVRGSIRFTAIGTQEAYTAVLMREALSTVDDPESALVRFIETLSTTEAAILRKSLDQREGRPVKSSRKATSRRSD